MSDPTSTVIAVMDTVDHLKSRARVPVQDPADVSRRVRQVYRDQDVPLSEAVLAEALASHIPPPVSPVSESLVLTPAAAQQPEQVSTQERRGGLGLLEVILALAVLVNCGVMVSVVYSNVNKRAAADQVSSALVSAAHQDVNGANQALKLEAVAQSFKKLAADWTVADQNGHTTIAVAHAPAMVGSLLAVKMETPTPNQSALELRVNGVQVKSLNDMTNLLSTTCGGRHCTTSDVSLTLTDTASH